MHTTVSSSFWRRLLGGALLAAAPLLGWAQQPQPADPPARVAYISAQDGSAWIASPGDSDWTQATLNWPVTTGSRLAIDPGARTELHGGSTVLRLSGQASLDVTRLDDSTFQVALTEGALSVRVRDLQPGERVEIDTPQLAIVANQPGEYRADVDPRAGVTRVTVRAGAATVFGEAGQSVAVAGGQQVSFAGRALAEAQRGAVSGPDALDQWAAARDALEDQSASARYLSRDMPGYQSLDNYGQWDQDPTYGAVWYPTVSDSDWAPYRDGRWSWVEPWGWTWVDDAPWGFAPFHYGRWTQIGPRWAWVPGPMAARPVYAPALVGFVGGGSGGAQWGISIGSGLPAAAWFPLAPGEYWQPSYRVSDRYRRRLNPGSSRPPSGGYRYQRRPDAISVGPSGGAGGRNPRGSAQRFGDGSRLPPGALNNARVVAPRPRANFAPSASSKAPMPRPDGLRSPAPRGQVSGAVVSSQRPAAPPPRPADGRNPRNGSAAAVRPAAPAGGVGAERERPSREQRPQPMPPRQIQGDVARPQPSQPMPRERRQRAEPTPPIQQMQQRPQNEKARPQRPVEQRSRPQQQPQRTAPSQPQRAAPRQDNRSMGGERGQAPATQRGRDADQNR